jgi:adhesin transport system outer membrane protein
LVRSSQSGVDSARWQYYPTPSLSFEAAGTSGNDTLYQGDNRVAIARLQQPLWTGGRLAAGVDKAAAGLTASQASLDEVKLQLGLRAIQTYGDWLSADLKALAHEKSLATHVRLREQTKRRLTEGVSSQSDLTLALTRLEAVSADVTAARSQADIAIARLSQLVGRQIDAATLRQTVALPRDLGLGPAGLTGLLELALAASPTVAKARAQARVQQATADERRADLLPEVYARLEYQSGNYNQANTAAQSRLFIGLSSRFGAGLSTLSNIEAAQTQYAAALSEIEVQSRTLTEQVFTDHAQALALTSRLQSMQTSLNSAEDVSASYDRQFLAGRKSWLDVMNAARELAQIEAQLADLQAMQVVVSWRLAACTRGIQALSVSTK